ncbi:MAG TPA: hypothetical protein VLH79_15205 [Chthonomonadales bacterium]|nr:hypothetical protein [Chthonomonadales bacterium]
MFKSDTIPVTVCVLLLHILGQPDRRKPTNLTNHVIGRWINDEGGVAVCPGGSTDVGASVKV